MGHMFCRTTKLNDFAGAFNMPLPIVSLGRYFTGIIKAEGLVPTKMWLDYVPLIFDELAHSASALHEAKTASL